MKSEFVSTPASVSTLAPTSMARTLRQRCACALVLLFTLGFASAAPAQARTLTVLHTFGNLSDGTWPESNLIRDSAGNFYGTTSGGGPLNMGTVFKLDSGSTETVLYSFTGGADGRYPIGGVIRDAAGNLYGTTYGGAPGTPTFGTIFKLDTAGHETTLYTFTGGADGGSPYGTLIRDAAGNLYGTASAGGNLSACTTPGHPVGCGVIFKLDHTGAFSVLHTFSGGADGAMPEAGVVRDAAGNFHGTASAGGNLSACTGLGVTAGCGVIFKLDHTGVFSVLYTFSGGTDGSEPLSPLTLDAAGNLYGTASRGGPTACQFGCGTLFKVDSSGTQTVLYSFPGGTFAASPIGPLLRDSAGYIWGSTAGGGRVGRGTVYRVDPAGTGIKLYNFRGGADGQSPYGGVIRDSAGNFYGTTYGGGTGGGTIFKLSR